jgi:hypothetical protein
MTAQHEHARLAVDVAQDRFAHLDAFEARSCLHALNLGAGLDIDQP